MPIPRPAPVLAFALAALLLAAATPTAQSSGHGVLQPGISVGGCTLGFALDGDDGSVYFAHAAHCGSQGDPVSSSQISNFGTVVYSDGWDFSLIRVHAHYASLVSGTVKGHPGVPTGIATQQTTSIGDLLQFSGYGLGYGFTPITQENRVGIVAPGGSANEYCADAMIHWGDSGGPVIHAPSGNALGIVSRLGTSCFPTSSLTGPTIDGGLARAAQNGYDLTLRTG